MKCFGNEEIFRGRLTDILCRFTRFVFNHKQQLDAKGCLLKQPLFYKSVSKNHYCIFSPNSWTVLRSYLQHLQRMLGRRLLALPLLNVCMCICWTEWGVCLCLTWNYGGYQSCAVVIHSVTKASQAKGLSRCFSTLSPRPYCASGPIAAF